MVGMHALHIANRIPSTLDHITSRNNVSGTCIASCKQHTNYLWVDYLPGTAIAYCKRYTNHIVCPPPYTNAPHTTYKTYMARPLQYANRMPTTSCALRSTLLHSTLMHSTYKVSMAQAVHIAKNMPPTVYALRTTLLSCTLLCSNALHRTPLTGLDKCDTGKLCRQK